jgi:hypothetical protein
MACDSQTAISYCKSDRWKSGDGTLVASAAAMPYRISKDGVTDRGLATADPRRNNSDNGVDEDHTPIRDWRTGG